MGLRGEQVRTGKNLCDNANGTILGHTHDDVVNENVATPDVTQPVLTPCMMT